MKTQPLVADDVILRSLPVWAVRAFVEEMIKKENPEKFFPPPSPTDAPPTKEALSNLEINELLVGSGGDGAKPWTSFMLGAPPDGSWPSLTTDMFNQIAALRLLLREFAVGRTPVAADAGDGDDSGSSPRAAAHLMRM